MVPFITQDFKANAIFIFGYVCFDIIISFFHFVGFYIFFSICFDRENVNAFLIFPFIFPTEFHSTRFFIPFKESIARHVLKNKETEKKLFVFHFFSRIYKMINLIWFWAVYQFSVFKTCSSSRKKCVRIEQWERHSCTKRAQQ